MTQTISYDDLVGNPSVRSGAMRRGNFGQFCLYVALLKMVLVGGLFTLAFVAQDLPTGQKVDIIIYSCLAAYGVLILITMVMIRWRYAIPVTLLSFVIAATASGSVSVLEHLAFGR